MQIMPLPSITCAPGALTLCRHRDDRAVAHMNVAGRQVADRRVHRQHIGAADHELAARRRRPGCRAPARQRRAATSPRRVNAVVPSRIVRRSSSVIGLAPRMTAAGPDFSNSEIDFTLRLLPAIKDCNGALAHIVAYRASVRLSAASEESK